MIVMPVLPVCSSCGSDIETRLPLFYRLVEKKVASLTTKFDRDGVAGIVLNQMGVKRYCCRRSFLTVEDPTELWDIKKVTKD